MSVLSVAAGLFSVFIFHIRLLLDGLPVGNLGTVQFHIHLIFIQKAADNDIQMLVAHTIEQGLSVLRIVYHLQGKIFIGQFLQCLGNLVHIPLILGLITHAGIRSGYLHLAVFDGSRLGGKAVARLRIAELCQRAQIPRVKLRHFHGFISLQDIQFADLLFHFGIHVVKQVIRLQNARVYLYQGIFSDKRVDNGFPDNGGFCLGKIIVRIVNLICLHIDSRDLAVLGAGHVFHNVIQQRVNTLAQYIGSHGHGNDGSVAHIGSQGGTDLRVGEGLPAKVTLHHLLAGLRHCFHECITADFQVFPVVFRHFTVHNFLPLPAMAGL